ncbi:hypothetical protein [Zavarzinia compransoris]|uniref:Uncharacterized protein n=1 Tax=Zavarzinia compransoris TaxID=1264899 RepID=A0A317E3S8_9PROT|nr:hypothetical protein [Zavarzinia compransoris]PWR21768.1 hypothetical protein DKG75_07200 [Zavarzinia compransoris]
MVVAVGKAKVQGAMPDFGAQLWQACTGTVKAGFTIVRGWQKGIKLQAKPRAELRALLDLPAMRAEQDKRFQVIASRALAQAEQWHKDGGATPVSKRLFCWFFDLLTQNGGLEWRNKASADQLELLCLSYLRSGLSDPKRRHVVLNRKGTIAMGTGWVNGGHWNLTVLND